MLVAGGTQTQEEMRRVPFLQHSSTSASLPFPPPQKTRCIFVNQRMQPRHSAPDPDDIGLFRASLQATGGNSMKPAEQLASMQEKGKRFGPDTTKNMQRLEIARTRRDSPGSPISPRVFRPARFPPMPLIESQYIDEHFPNSATSRATNRLPLPAETDFGKAIRVRKTAVPGIRETFGTQSALLLDMYKHVDKSLSKTLDRRKSTLPDNTIQLHWSVRATLGNRPESREGASMCVLDRKIYLFGGQSMTKRNDVRVLNTDNWTWTMLQTEYPPKGRIGHSLVACRNQLLLFGGWSHYSQRLRIRRCVKKIYTMYLDQEIRWQRYRGNGTLPKSRRYHSACVLGGSMLIYGGVDPHSKVLKALSVLEIDSLIWKKPQLLTEETPGRRSNASLTAVFHGSLLSRSDFSVFAIPKPRMDQVMPHSGFYLFGGLNEKGKVVGDLWALTVAEGEFMWRHVETTGVAPLPRSDHAAVYVSGYLVLFGGRNDDLFPDHGDSCIRDVSLLDIEKLRWESVKCFGVPPDGRWGHCAVSCGSRMFVIGGINTKSFLPSDLYVLETDQPFVTEFLRQETEKQTAKAARLTERRRSNMLK